MTTRRSEGRWRRSAVAILADEAAPSLRAATAYGTTGGDPAGSILSPTQRLQLESIATRLRLRRRTMIYGEATPARWVFIVGRGAVKSFRDLPSGKRRIAVFLFEGDVFGLAEHGCYVNNAQAITDVQLYRLPVDELERLFLHDAHMQLKFLCKVTHALRQAQRQKIVLTRRDAVGRLAMFLDMLDKGRGGASERVPVPMSRSDIASFLGLSLEAVSRATAALKRDQVVTFADAHTARILDRGRFERLVADV
jgi:CRP/FNR family transcriptional regulator